mmetsp:Transcript_8202/g.21545  ORF Transcript_8202/g.21545 Transcript_8202/m.21545 type:complete len:206 (-) Transcript_8202:723-1340(-)
MHPAGEGAARRKDECPHCGPLVRGEPVSARANLPPARRRGPRGGQSPAPREQRHYPHHRLRRARDHGHRIRHPRRPDHYRGFRGQLPVHGGGADHDSGGPRDPPQIRPRDIRPILVPHARRKPHASQKKKAFDILHPVLAPVGHSSPTSIHLQHLCSVSTYHAHPRRHPAYAAERPRLQRLALHGDFPAAQQGLPPTRWPSGFLL